MSGQNGAPSGGLPPDVQAAINISLGAVVVSNYLSFLTMGAVGCYTWMYFRTFPDDRWVFKLLVSACFIMCLVDTAGTGIWVYDWAVTGYANPGVMAVIHWALLAEGIGTTGTLVQCFYAWRIWLISTKKNWILPVIIVCLSLAGWCAICYVISVVAVHKLVSELSLVSPTIYIWLGGFAGADVLITISMIYYLDLRFRMKEASRIGPGTNSRFREIIYRTIECNVLSTLAQATTIGLFQSHSLGFYFVLGRRSNGTGLSGFRNSSKSGGEQHGLSDLRGRNQNSGAALEVAINVQRETAEDSTGWDKTSSDFDQVQKVRLPDV
ncbi:hypothetical protein DFH08DRAFT_1027937 [Mycena albidolilacea]|uniref:Uncharacterized protein n=1 Tax=Mycena albidolilacea TaxID=1033008 RepID=A0AAD7EI58_9AGAR|nr:hypothetical protein DFH08DRAFT_1027937 [Mycena albidolilacea]